MSVHYWTPVWKQTSIRWKKKDETASRKFKSLPADSKVMPTVFWDWEGIFLIEYQLQWSIVTSTSYFDTILHLRNAIKDKRRGKLFKKDSSVLPQHSFSYSRSDTTAVTGFEVGSKIARIHRLVGLECQAHICRHRNAYQYYSLYCNWKVCSSLHLWMLSKVPLMGEYFSSAHIRFFPPFSKYPFSIFFIFEYVVDEFWKTNPRLVFQETPPSRSLGPYVHYDGIFVHYEWISVHYERIIGHHDGITTQYCIEWHCSQWISGMWK